MRKITRIKITNYGAESWFKDITLNLTDPASQQATDTIINLENGGGKTTMLAFIFSCFEPRQERFLQHIQKKQHQFTDYFAKDGTPGVILIEWQTPGQDDRLVIGQVVSVLPEKASPDRAFFAFSANGPDGMDQVPMSFTTFAEWSHWLQAQQGQGDFFHTRGQNDWQRHLDTRLIDVDVFRLQLEFSAEEGGIDAFLNFRNESEFVRRFFRQTLDRDRAGSVRTVVAQTCDALGRKPRLQQQHRELTTLATEVAGFEAAAQAYENDVGQQGQNVAQASGVVRALLERAATHEAEAQALNERAAGYAQVEKDGEGRLSALEHDQQVLEGLALRRAVEDAQARQDALRETLDDARTEARILTGAQSLMEVDAARTRLQGLRDTANAQQSGLAPAREEAGIAGERLRNALGVVLSAAQATITTLSDTVRVATAVHNDQQRRLGELDRQRQTLERRHADLSAQVRLGLAQRERLVQDGLILPHETTAEAQARWFAQAQALQNTHEEQQAQAQASDERAEQQRTLADQARRNGDDARGLLTAARQEQAEGQAQHEALSQSPILAQALESDQADPDAPGLAVALNRLIASDEASIAQFNVRRAQLESDRQAVHDTGVAGRQADVDAVVAHLHKHGVPGAQPFNLYLAQHLNDAATAQALVLSDPARFLGVGVPEDDLPTARKAIKGLTRLRAPVVISPLTLAGPTVPEDHLVVAPANAAAFNRAAALEHVQGVDRDLATLDESLRLARERRDTAVAVREQLRVYTERFGAEQRTMLERTLSTQSTRLADAQEQERAARAQAQLDQDVARRTHQAVQASGLELQQLSARVRTLTDHRTTHEDQQAEREAACDQIANELDELGAVREDVMVAMAQADERRDKARAEQLELQARTSQLRFEINGLVYQTPKGPVAPLGDEVSLDELRRRFRDAVQLLNTQEQERMGVLKVKLDQAESEVAGLQKAFDARFGDLPVAWLRDRFGPTLDADVQQAQQAETAAQDAVNTASTALTLARHDLSSFDKAHRRLGAPTPAQEALDPNALAAARSALAEDHAQWQAKLDEARAQVGTVRDRARDAKDLARRLASHAATLRTVVDVDPDASAVDLGEDVDTLVKELLDGFKSLDKASSQSRKKAEKAFRELITMISRPAFQEVEPALADGLRSSAQDFEAACGYATVWREQVAERLSTVQHQLDSMSANFEGCVDELMALTRDGERVLASAVANKRVPANAPMVGGKAVIRMKTDLSRTPLDGKRQALSAYLDELIETRQLPELGTDLVAESLFRIHGASLGLQLLKMVPNEERQYMPVGEIKSSGGEGVTMALFLYMVINQLRAEMQAQKKQAGGGPLILDNPFAKMTNGSMWGAVRALADAMDIQLICATAISAEYNAFGEFRRFVRLRRTGTNPITQKTHLEVADLVIKARPANGPATA